MLLPGGWWRCCFLFVAVAVSEISFAAAAVTAVMVLDADQAAYFMEVRDSPKGI